MSDDLLDDLFVANAAEPVPERGAGCGRWIFFLLVLTLGIVCAAATLAEYS